MLHLLLVDGHRCIDLPLGGGGKGTFVRTPFAAMTSVAHQLALDPQPGRKAFQRSIQLGLSISFTGEALVGQMPELLPPGVFGLVHLALERCLRSRFAQRGTHDHPAFLPLRQGQGLAESLGLAIGGVLPMRWLSFQNGFRFF